MHLFNFHLAQHNHSVPSCYWQNSICIAVSHSIIVSQYRALSQYRTVSQYCGIAQYHSITVLMYQCNQTLCSFCILLERTPGTRLSCCYSNTNWIVTVIIDGQLTIVQHYLCTCWMSLLFIVILDFHSSNILYYNPPTFSAETESTAQTSMHWKIKMFKKDHTFSLLECMRRMGRKGAQKNGKVWYLPNQGINRG